MTSWRGNTCRLRESSRLGVSARCASDHRRMGKDRQGKMRGKCGIEGCDCEEFNPPERGVKCAACTHVPVKHVLLDGDAGQGGGGSTGELVT